MIISAREQYRVYGKRQVTPYQWVEIAARATNRAALVDWHTHGSVYAIVNHSRWVAQCPHCPNAMYVMPGMPFWCTNCLMTGNRGMAMEVDFLEEMDAIERVLLLRPDPKTRNWGPHETLDQLVAQNMEHGHWKEFE